MKVLSGTIVLSDFARASGSSRKQDLFGVFTQVRSSIFPVNLLGSWVYCQLAVDSQEPGAVPCSVNIRRPDDTFAELLKWDVPLMGRGTEIFEVVSPLGALTFNGPGVRVLELWADGQVHGRCALQVGPELEGS